MFLIDNKSMKRLISVRLCRLIGPLLPAAVAVLALLPVLVVAMSNDPRHWINRMHIAVDSTNYHGTLVRLRQSSSATADAQSETFRIYHRAVDGEVSERLVGMDGDGFEVIRSNSETICVFPERRSVVVEPRANSSKSPLAAGLPAYSETMEGHYTFAVIADERIAGRKAKVLQIAAADEYRYGYRIWLDTKTAMPLKSQLRSSNGQSLLEEVMFAEITLQAEVDPLMVVSAYDISKFDRVMPQANKVVERSAEDISWAAVKLPPGFVLTAVHHETMPDAAEPRLHLVYTDGLASVSVFIDSAEPDQYEGAEVMGATHAFTVMVGGQVVTAIGQVPAETARQIASLMRYQP